MPLATIFDLLPGRQPAWSTLVQIESLTARRRPCLLADAAPACRDVPAPGAFTCKQQQSWGKCKETWMIQGGWCAATCGRCGGAIAPPNSPSPSPTPTPVPPQLTGNVREYGKVIAGELARPSLTASRSLSVASVGLTAASCRHHGAGCRVSAEHTG